MAALGVPSLDELVGRIDLLAAGRRRPRPWLKHRPRRAARAAPDRGSPASAGRRTRPRPGRSTRVSCASSPPAWRRRAGAAVAAGCATPTAAIGALLAGEIARRGPDGLAETRSSCRLTGNAGQSLGAWAPRGLTIDLEGPANDYAGKGLSGGASDRASGSRSRVRHDDRTSSPATRCSTARPRGEAFFRGRAGERFAVRNSGATAVVEGVGDHGCEYMTGGAVVVLGPVGRNFAAGMSGGVAFLLDADGVGPRGSTARSVALEAVDRSPTTSRCSASCSSATRADRQRRRRRRCSRTRRRPRLARFTRSCRTISAHRRSCALRDGGRSWLTRAASCRYSAGVAPLPARSTPVGATGAT